MRPGDFTPSFLPLNAPAYIPIADTYTVGGNKITTRQILTVSPDGTWNFGPEQAVNPADQPILEAHGYTLRRGSGNRTIFQQTGRK
jgi:hypothetical protein